MQVDSPESAPVADTDPNDWDEKKESVFEFMHREYNRLLPKFPAEFGPEKFRIYFTATADTPEYPIKIEFDVAVYVTAFGKVTECGRNPSVATMRLIESLYKRYAILAQQREEGWRQARRDQEAAARYGAARQSLLNYEPFEIAQMVDGRASLPADVTMDMARERARKIRIDTVRDLSDAALLLTHAPAFLSEEERKDFGKRCHAELRSRSCVREILADHHKQWPAGKDDYIILLQIWKLCNRQGKTLEDVLFDFFRANEYSSRNDLTLERLLAIAPEVIKKVRRATALANMEAWRIRDDERKATQQDSRGDLEYINAILNSGM